MVLHMGWQDGGLLGALICSLSPQQHNTSEDRLERETREREREKQSDKRSHPIAAPSSPTLAELNSEEKHMPHAFSSTSSTILPPHYSCAVSDSSASSHGPPQVAFVDRDGYDNLSSSFHCLYKSIFGQSDFIDVATSPASCSELAGSLPLPASASLLPAGVGGQHFASLMDSFREIAESKSWDKLDPAQVQGLVESFRLGEHDRFGLDPDTYAELSTSFNEFLSQLNSRFLTGSADTPRLNEFHCSQLLGPPTPKYGHRGDTHAVPSTSVFHGNTPTPSSHLSPSSAPTLGEMLPPHSHTSHPYPSYIPSDTPPPAAVTTVTDPSSLPFKSAATDLFDDADEFDWSKLM